MTDEHKEPDAGQEVNSRTTQREAVSEPTPALGARTKAAISLCKSSADTSSFVALVICSTELETENATLRQQLADLERNLSNWGTVEIAIRNPAVAEHMRHWEGRVEQAEHEVALWRYCEKYGFPVMLMDRTWKAPDSKDIWAYAKSPRGAVEAAIKATEGKG